MSQVSVKCEVCGNGVVFAEDPYDNVTATRYWKSTYDEPEESLFVVQRRVPSVNKKGRMSVQIFNEHILKIYCGPQCGLEDYERNRT